MSAPSDHTNFWEANHNGIDTGRHRPRKGTGLSAQPGHRAFSGRIVPTGTVFTAWELIATAELAARFGNGKVIPTVRMTLELPGIPYERIDEAISFAAARGCASAAPAPRSVR